MVVSSLCPVCKKDATKSIEYDSCKQWFHSACAALPAASFAKFSSSDEPWVCHGCISRVSAQLSRYSLADIAKSIKDLSTQVVETNKNVSAILKALQMGNN